MFRYVYNYIHTHTHTPEWLSVLDEKKMKRKTLSDKEKDKRRPEYQGGQRDGRERKTCGLLTRSAYSRTSVLHIFFFSLHQFSVRVAVVTTYLFFFYTRRFRTTLHRTHARRNPGENLRTELR